MNIVRNFEGGKLKSETHFEDHKKTLVINYFKNSKVRERINYNNNKKHGLYEKFNCHGVKLVDCIYVNGKHTELTLYGDDTRAILIYENKKVIEMRMYKNEILIKLNKKYFENEDFIELIETYRENGDISERRICRNYVDLTIEHF
jgi:antitoxin component YwqK of YwqJK toxin-antitoxin module